MKFALLSDSEYNDFASQQDRLFLPQTAEYGRVRRREGMRVDYPAVRADDGTVLAAGLLTYQPWKRFFLRAQLVYGPTLDWRNREVAGFFLDHLEAFLRKNRRVLSLRLNPPVAKAYYRDTTKTGDAEIGTATTALLASHGYQHVDKEFSEQADVQVRFIYTKEIAGKDFEEIADSLTPTMRRQVKHVGRYGVSVKFLGPEDFEIFERLHESSRERTHMAPISAASARLYKDLLREMGPERSLLLVAYASPAAYLKEINANLEQLGKQIAKNERPPETTKKVRALKELNNQRDSQLRAREGASRLLAQYGDNVPFAAVLAYRCGNEIVQLLRGLNKDFTVYNRDYPIESALLRWAADRGDITMYNTFGITGDFSRDAEDYNVLEYKRKLDGNVEEFLGMFVKPLSLLAGPLGAIS